MQYWPFKLELELWVVFMVVFLTLFSFKVLRLFLVPPHVFCDMFSIVSFYNLCQIWSNIQRSIFNPYNFITRKAYNFITRKVHGYENYEM